MNNSQPSLFNLADFVPDLRLQFEQKPLKPDGVILAAVPVKDPNQARLVPALGDRGEVVLTDVKESWDWQVDSLRALFRGDKQPPNMNQYPAEYTGCFVILERHVLELARFFDEPRDLEMKDVFGALRRRPDGQSMGFTHDYMWQAAALLLGSRPLSQAEFEAIIGRLERFCKTVSIGTSSRNYVAQVRQLFAQL